MEEYIDIVTKDGASTGVSALKSEIHSKGHYHNTAHIWLYTSDQKILLQQRAATKVICPLLWDVSVAGHVDAGETLKSGAVREVEEEIGLIISETNLHKIGIFECFQSYDNGIVDNEFHHTYICELKSDIDTLTSQESEVEALKLVSFEEFKELLKHSKTNNHFVASNRDYYFTVLNAIKNISLQH